MDAELIPAGVEAAIDGLLGRSNSPYLPARSVINPLLDLWSAVHEVDPVAAIPVEDLLTALCSRHLVSSSELAVVCDDVRALLH